MINSWRTLNVFCTALAALFILAGCTTPPPANFNEQVAAAIYKMGEKDQEVRREALTDPGDATQRGTLRLVDRQNTEELRAIIKQYGWPGRSLVGQRGANTAWLIVQHADHDRAFQKQCLKLMVAAPAGEVAPEDMAFLTDRVLLAEGKKQRYGTQFKKVGGHYVPQPLEDEANVDVRRKKLGLSTLAEYARQLGDVYGSPVAPK